MRRLGFLSLSIVPVLALGACSSSSSTNSATTSATAAVSSGGVSSTTNGAGRVLRVLVTNDDGVHAPGIDALVQALRAVPQVSVTVVAPATNQSGTAEKTTGGKLTVDSTTTASGYPATAVHGYPADTIVWAIDDHGVAQRPDVVLSGVNNGQNIGFAVDLSGTVGAARAAAQRGIPALAVSAGIGAHPDFAGAASAAIGWLGRARAGLLVPVPAGGHRAADVTNINVPTCPRGSPRPLVVVPVAPKSANAFARVDCVSPAGKPVNDVDGFVHGYIVESNEVALHPPAST